MSGHRLTDATRSAKAPAQPARTRRAGQAPQCSNQVVQAKLRLGPADDPLEREADRVAKRVISAE
jgi:hypothetical protein